MIKEKIKKWFVEIDKVLLFSIIVLSISGLILIVSGSPYIATRIGLEPYHFFYNQIFYMIPSFLIMVFVSCLNHKGIKIITFFIMICAILAMVFVILFATPIKGSKRWLYIFGFSIQPSEFIKPCFLVFASLLITKEKYIISILIYVFIIVLLLLQPDFGTSALLTISFLSQIFVSGIPLIFCFLIFAIGIIFSVISFLFIPHIKVRLDKFFLGSNNSDNFQVMKSIEAFSNGGMLGVGPGEGIIKYHLPDAHTDFIFAVAGEELGILYCLFILIVFGIFISRVFLNISYSKDRFVIVGLLGLVTQFFLQVFINIGVSIGILPTKGMTLPFVSYGGSSIIALGISMGIILSLSHKYDK